MNIHHLELFYCVAIHGGISEAVRKQYPELGLSLRSGYQPQIEDWLRQNAIDLAAIALSSRPAPPLNAQILKALPPVILALESSPYKKAKDLWACDKIEEPLISLPATETVTQHFQKGLAALNIDWPIGIEASSLALIQEYALNGYGLGLSLTIPNNRLDSRLRAIPPEGFEPVEIGVLWQGEASPLAQAFIQAMQERAQVVGG